jgi:26S proteasome regulatory subunit N1
MLKTFETFPVGEMKKKFSDILSVVGMVASEEEDSNDALKYCLTGTRTDLVTWGHEYLRALAGQIGAEYDRLSEESENTEDLLKLVD